MGGRVRRRSEEKEQFWRQMVDGHAGSGLSVRRYCSDRGVSEQSFFAWRKELARRDAAARQKRARSPSTNQSPAPIRFAQLQIASGELVGAACLEIVLPTGVRIRVPRGACRDTLSDVLGLLERRPC
jgi:transposase-like protein